MGGGAFLSHTEPTAYKPGSRFAALTMIADPSPVARRPQLVEHDPVRARRRTRVVALAWISSLALLYAGLMYFAYPDVDRLRAERDAARSTLAAAEERIAALEVDSARYMRGQQVAERANAELQQALEARQDEIAALRTDLGFYQRLMEGGSQQAGLTIHSLVLKPTDEPRAFHYTLTLSQNPSRNRQVKGAVEISVTGSSGEDGKRLDLAELGAESRSVAFSLRYFQRLSGVILLPGDFTPATVAVKVVPDSGAQLNREFTWGDVLDKEQG
jgi:hypothetical protein